jgi:hypothetical protein
MRLYLGDTGLGGVDRILLAQDRDRWQVIVSAVKFLQVLAPRSQSVSQLVSQLVSSDISTLLTLLLRIWKVPGSNICPESGYHDWSFSWIFSVIPEEFRDSTLKLCHDHFLSNAYFIRLSPFHYATCSLIKRR